MPVVQEQNACKVCGGTTFYRYSPSKRQYKGCQDAKNLAHYYEDKPRISAKRKERYAADPEAALAVMAARRKQIRGAVNAHKSQPCMDCKGKFHVVCMDFDHRDGVEKLDNVATMVAEGRPLGLIEAEIAKCDVVCSNCHRIRTLMRRGEDSE